MQCTVLASSISTPDTSSFTPITPPSTHLVIPSLSLQTCRALMGLFWKKKRFLGWGFLTHFWNVHSGVLWSIRLVHTPCSVNTSGVQTPTSYLPPTSPLKPALILFWWERGEGNLEQRHGRKRHARQAAVWCFCDMSEYARAFAGEEGKKLSALLANLKAIFFFLRSVRHFYLHFFSLLFIPSFPFIRYGLLSEYTRAQTHPL